MTQNRNTTVVLVNYKSANYVRACIESMIDETVLRVIVVDNYSGKDELERLNDQLEKFGPLVEVIANPRNDGFGAGVNIGAAEAMNHPDCRYLWILNPDTEVKSGCLTRMHETLTAGADIVSPVIVTGPPHRSIVWFAGGDLNTKEMTTPHHSFGELITDDLFDSAFQRCSFLTGASMLIPKAIWQQLGGFRTDLFMYWEDADLCMRAGKLQLRLAVATQARLWHAVGATSSESGLSPLYYYHMQRNRVILAREWGMLSNLWRGRGLRQTVKLLVDPYLESNNRISAGLKSASGLADGFRYKGNQHPSRI